jgi:hypothetical protein
MVNFFIFKENIFRNLRKFSLRCIEKIIKNQRKNPDEPLDKFENFIILNNTFFILML